MLSPREIALCRKNASEKSSAFQGTGMGSVEKGARYYFIVGLSGRVRCFASSEEMFENLHASFTPVQLSAVLFPV